MLRQKHLAEPYSWNLPKFDSPFERRRLRILNGLFLGFAKVGGSPWIRGDDTRELSIHMGESSVSFELEAIGRRRDTRDREPPKANEKLRLTVKSQTPLPSGVVGTWEDSESSPLEKRIAEVIVGMAVAGQHLHRIWAEQQAVWRRELQEQTERRERERREDEERKERERLAAIEQAKRDELLEDAKAWKDAAMIRSYVAAVRSISPGTEGASNFESWTRWALAEADRLDPITSGRALRPVACAAPSCAWR